MEILGHSQIAVTMNTDTHVVLELQRDAVDRLADAFNGSVDSTDVGRQHGVAVTDPADTDPENDEVVHADRWPPPRLLTHVDQRPFGRRPSLFGYGVCPTPPPPGASTPPATPGIWGG
jgi:hypothetical protein